MEKGQVEFKRPGTQPPERKKCPQAHMLQAHLEIAPFAQLVGRSTSQAFEVGQG